MNTQIPRSAGQQVAEALNERFSAQYGEVDALLFQATIAAAMQDPVVRAVFACEGEDQGEDTLRHRMHIIVGQVRDRQAKMVERIVVDDDFGNAVKARLSEAAYRGIRAA